MNFKWKQFTPQVRSHFSNQKFWLNKDTFHKAYFKYYIPKKEIQCYEQHLPYLSTMTRNITCSKLLKNNKLISWLLFWICSKLTITLQGRRQLRSSPTNVVHVLTSFLSLYCAFWTYLVDSSIVFNLNCEHEDVYWMKSISLTLNIYLFKKQYLPLNTSSNAPVPKCSEN